MAKLENSHPDMFNHMLNQSSIVSLSGQPVTQISCDQVIELTINRASKDAGGLPRKTAAASERWMRINHLLEALREELDQVT